MEDILAQLREALKERYTVERELGRGGMATVYLASEHHPARQVAIKVMNPQLANAMGRERFLREVTVCAKLTHPHIVPIFAAGGADGLLYYVMPYVEGETLRHRMMREGQLSASDALRIARDVARALHYAHRQGIVHRDIKPENILLADEHAVVADFGIARAVSIAGGANLTRSGVPVGTPRYMSPEQAMGRSDVGVTTDVYSLGCVLYEMLVGGVPNIWSDTKAAARGRVSDTPPEHRRSLKAVPPAVERVIATSLARSPDDRPSAAEFDRALGEVGGENAAASFWQRESPRKLLGIAATGLVVVAALVAAWLLREASRPTATGRVVVAAFENQTGDPALDPVGQMAADWIAQGLAQAGVVEVVSPRTAITVQRTLAGRAATTGGPTLTALARETRAGTVVSGVYYLVRDTLRFQCQIADGAGGAILAAVDEVRSPVDEPLQGVETLRRRVMGTLATIMDPRLASWAGRASQPPSFEAYQAYVDGLDRFMDSKPAEALPHLLQAAALDSAFATPRLSIAFAYTQLGRLAEADSVLTAANRGDLSTFDRLFLDWLRALVDGDYQTSLTVARRATTALPSTETGALVAVSAMLVNRPRELVDALEGMDPDHGLLRSYYFYWVLLGTGYHLLGEHRNELASARRGTAEFPDQPGVVLGELRALGALGRVAEMRRVIAELPRGIVDPAAITGTLVLESADELRAHGQEAAGDSLAGLAVAWLEGLPASEVESAVVRSELGRALYAVGRLDEAAAIFEELSAALPDSVSYRGFLGTIAARQGRRGAAQAIAATLGAQESRPYLLGIHRYWQGRIAALLGDDDGAMAHLRAAVADGYGQFRYGYAYSFHNERDLEGLRGSAPFETLIEPRD